MRVVIVVCLVAAQQPIIAADGWVTNNTLLDSQRRILANPCHYDNSKKATVKTTPPPA
jgi:hypothetical protein